MIPQKNSSSIALITGGATRIGKAISLFLAQKGYQVALHYNHSFCEAQKTLTEIHDNAEEAQLFKAELSNEKEFQALIPLINKKMGPISLLINNASIFKKSTFKNGDIHSLSRHWEVNLKAPYILSQIFAQQTSQGQIINLLDTKITKDSTPYFDYLLSKKSFEDLTRMTALELAPNIRVNAIAPGLILAPEGKDKNYLKKLAQNIPLKRKGEVEDILKTLSFFLDCDFVTGQVIYVDGGNHLQ